MAWLEAERPALVRVDDLAREFELDRARASDVLRRMTTKGWLTRVAQGAYQPLLADSGGWAVPDAWAAVAAWRVGSYVSYASAAYELGLTPDRPGAVQVVVPFGTTTPARFQMLPISLIPQRVFSFSGTTERRVRDHIVRIAGVERVLVDAALRPSRVAGAISLGRVAHRALDQADWALVAELADEHPRGSSAARRLAALLTLLDEAVPDPLAELAKRRRPANPTFLDNRSIYGRRGPVLDDWQIRVNVPVEALREELKR
jgi:predicted transcriptional regulator of viral defense system